MSLTDSRLYKGFCLHESMGVIVMQSISISILGRRIMHGSGRSKIWRIEDLA